LDHFLSPLTALNYAHHLQKKGMDVLLILDDFISHLTSENSIFS
jgi:F0F1-type ATP synthase alpha subunit